MSNNKPQTDSESATQRQETGELRVFYSSSGEKRPASKRKSILGAEWRSVLTRHGRSRLWCGWRVIKNSAVSGHILCWNSRFFFFTFHFNHWVFHTSGSQWGRRTFCYHKIFRLLLDFLMLFNEALSSLLQLHQLNSRLLHLLTLHSVLLYLVLNNCSSLMN